MKTKTYNTKAKDIQREWWVVDATDQILGRLAASVAAVLRGKHKPMFTPHLDTGDHVIVINAAKVKLSADKASKKVAYRHSGYPGGIRAIPYEKLLRERPEVAVENAIRGMLPRNKIGRAMFRKLKVYRGAEHPHSSQNPKPFGMEVK
jgi:large subunit ribosomal protein L13